RECFHSFHDRKRLANRAQSLAIESLAEQHAIADEDDVSGQRINRGAARGKQRPLLPRIQRDNVRLVSLARLAGPGLREIKEMLAIGQETWPSVAELTGFQLRYRNRRSSLCGDPGDRIPRAAAKDDHSVTAPTAAAGLTASR